MTIVLRSIGATLLAAGLVLVPPGQVAGADTVYPENTLLGSTFDAGLSGWSSTLEECAVVPNLMPTPDVTCQVRNDHHATGGNPGGALRSEFRSVVSGTAVVPPLSLFEGRGTIRSPSFTVSGSGPATLRFDRRVQMAALMALNGQGTYTFVLVNESTPGEQPLAAETVVANTLLVPPTFDSGFETMTAPAVPVTGGQAYRLEIRTEFLQQVLQSSQGTFTFFFDNIGLRVADGTPTFVSPPTAITDAATDVTTTTGTLHGRTNAHGRPSTYVFRYGTAPDLSGATVVGPFDAGTGTSLEPRSLAIAGLAPCTVHYFRIEATNALGTTVGEIRSFRTPPRTQWGRTWSPGWWWSARC